MALNFDQPVIIICYKETIFCSFHYVTDKGIRQRFLFREVACGNRHNLESSHWKLINLWRADRLQPANSRRSCITLRNCQNMTYWVAWVVISLLSTKSLHFLIRISLLSRSGKGWKYSKFCRMNTCCGCGSAKFGQVITISARHAFDHFKYAQTFYLA